MGLREHRPRSGGGREGQAISARIKMYDTVLAEKIAGGMEREKASDEAYRMVTKEYRYNARTKQMEKI